MTLYRDGDAAFDAMWEAVAAARDRVWWETYILEADRVGEHTMSLLAEAARRGCDVLLLYDHAGSLGLPRSFLTPLWEAGGRVIAFNPIWPWRRRGPLAFRDHRKLLIADGAAFCGSMNVSEDYGGTHHGNGRFHDVQLRVEGPAVGHLVEVLNDALGHTGALPVPVPEGVANRVEDGVTLRVLPSNPARELHLIQREFRRMTRQARRYLYLTTPYFLPSPQATRSILAAAARGVEVKLLTAGASDVRLARMAARHAYGTFLKGGVRIFELADEILHAKTVSKDGEVAHIGSFNLDPFSEYRNLEVGVTVDDPRVASQVEEGFLEDVTKATEWTLERWLHRPRSARLAQRVAYRLLRWGAHRWVVPRHA